ncbi:hypothetical protein BKA61DRAFT_654053 [Leptodontidium sp. MPI-SDFR-AT-0119]|nr:hypothetical protein BKA61DRAFT_654053 [Leptodontidium sp. MPI-SDFR-AT-0119]
MEKGSKERRSKKDPKISKSSHDRSSRSIPLTKSELRELDCTGSEGSPLVYRDLLSPRQSSDSGSDTQSEISYRTSSTRTPSTQSSIAPTRNQKAVIGLPALTPHLLNLPDIVSLPNQAKAAALPYFDTPRVRPPEPVPDQVPDLVLDLVLDPVLVLSLEAAHGHLHTDLSRDTLRNPNIPSPAAKTTQNLSLANYISMEASRRSVCGVQTCTMMHSNQTRTSCS